MTTNLEELQELAPTAMVAIGETIYELKRLDIGELAASTQFLHAKRQQRYCESTRAIPIPQETMAQTMADIACRAVSLYDVFNDWASRMWVIDKGFRNAGFKGNRQALEAAIKDMPLEQVGEILNVLIGLKLYARKADNGSDPTTSTPS